MAPKSICGTQPSAKQINYPPPRTLALELSRLAAVLPLRRRPRASPPSSLSPSRTRRRPPSRTRGEFVPRRPPLPRAATPTSPRAAPAVVPACLAGAVPGAPSPPCQGIDKTARERETAVRRWVEEDGGRKRAAWWISSPRIRRCSLGPLLLRGSAPPPDVEVQEVSAVAGGRGGIR
ncbi:hypothetical protein PVAP13_9NG696300 [Panicum virgatum]|uniref:Uncharacterized protein n=1 Tax=Panicum virgatum TaxID=38727 RepID=A0A8T0MXJ6_PANVG|nr:hypothetical protein PVAP13_9NG696300 [Panicum virgatum]